MALTKHEEGSLRELWAIAFPLMLSSFSVMSMLFVDRVLLARYSTAAFNASVNASTVGWAFVFSWMVLTGIAEVFVAQYNGANQKHKLGEPVWQMIWLSLFSSLFFIPLGIWGGPLLFQLSPYVTLESEYFKWMMLFGPSFTLYTALCSFFVGQGKTYLITAIAIIANVVNAGLDYVLIFGIEGYTPSLGITGAVVATCGSSLFQVVILWIIFLKPIHREENGTANYHFQPDLFLKCLKVGIPSSVFVAIEVFGWAAFYSMMTVMGERYITVAGINQSIVIMFYFFAEGISKATSAIVGNFIGARATHQVAKVVKAGVILNLIFFLILLGVFSCMENTLMTLFLPEASAELVNSMGNTLFICLMCSAFYLFFEGLRYTLSGVLTAAGDTIFLLVAGSLSVWLLFVIPVYLAMMYFGASVETAMYLGVFYSCGVCVIYLWRFLEGHWKTKVLIN